MGYTHRLHEGGAFGPVIDANTDEVVLSPNNSAVAIVIPANCSGIYCWNAGGANAYITPDNGTLDSGIGLAAGEGIFLAVAEASTAATIYAATDNVGIVAVNITRFYG